MFRRGLILCTVLLGTGLHAPGGQAERIAELMRIAPGMHVADVGAGDGEWAEELARRVGETGHVYVQEIDDGELMKIRRRVERSKLGNMSVVVGDAADTRLPEACCDAILLRYVYHHMSDPAPMRASLGRSLRPGGLLLIIEKLERSGHGIGAPELIPDWTDDGWKLISEHPAWQGHDGHYAVLLRRRS